MKKAFLLFAIMIIVASCSNDCHLATNHDYSVVVVSQTNNSKRNNPS